jgi:hypothetical protein
MTAPTQATKPLSSAGERLRYIRAMLRVSRSYLQEKHGLPEVTLKAWESGTVNVTQSGVKRCIEVYKQEGLIVNEDWILEGIGLDPTSQLSVGRYFSTPTHKDLPIEDDEIAMIRDANDFKEKYSNAVVMIVSNDEMRPFFKPGDYVGGKMRFGDEIQSCINKNCIIKLKNNDQYFRRLIKNSRNGYNLACLNPNENTEEPVLYNADIEGAAPVIWHRWKDD